MSLKLVAGRMLVEMSGESLMGKVEENDQQCDNGCGLPGENA